MQEEKESNDYILPQGDSCWITVGNKSIHIVNNCGVSGQAVHIYELGKEMEDSLCEIDLESI